MTFSFSDYIKSFFIELWNVCRNMFLSITGIIKGNEYGEAAKEKIATVVAFSVVAVIFLGVVFLFLSFFSGVKGDYYDNRSGKNISVYIPDFLNGGIGQFLIAVLILLLLIVGVFDCLFIDVRYDISFGVAIILSVLLLLLRLFLGVIFALICAVIFIFATATVIFIPVFVICLVFSPIYHLINERCFRISVSSDLCGNIYVFNMTATAILIALPTIALYIIINIMPIFMYLSVK